MDGVRERLNSSVCTATSCSFDNTYQPVPIPSTLKFIAISAWYSTFNNLAPNVSLAPNVNLAPNADGNYDFNSVKLSQIKSAISAICEQPWDEIPKPDKYRPCKIQT